MSQIENEFQFNNVFVQVQNELREENTEFHPQL